MTPGGRSKNPRLYDRIGRIGIDNSRRLDYSLLYLCPGHIRWYTKRQPPPLEQGFLLVWAHLEGVRVLLQRFRHGQVR